MHVTTARIVTLAGMTKETERAAGEAFLEWLESPAGRELCASRKGLLLIHELAVDAAMAVKHAEEQPDEAENE